MTNGIGPSPDEHPPNGAGPEWVPGTALEDLPVLDPATAPVLEAKALRPAATFIDRFKLLVFLIALFWLLVWGASVNNPIQPFSDALGHELHSLWWLEGLVGIELLRQAHYLISEHWSGWHRFFDDKFFGGLHRLTGRIGDWNRFRLGRFLRFVLVLVLLAVLLAGFYHVSPAVSLFQVPAAFVSALPLIVQVIFFMFLAVIQFVAIFWFMSRGGIDVYFPGDVKTRFSDVWGQDSVLARVKENIIFLRDPESIESRGGYVPGGILLWGPPGTGKTLIAEAVAGETHNPFVFVDPGAFQNMFMGVGILKVKSLFRKLRRLALRYGGVVVFFDEADSLGNRGNITAGGIFGPNRFTAHGWSATAGCHGMSYLGPSSAVQLLSGSRSNASTLDDEAPRRRVSGMMAGAMAGGAGMGTLQSLLSELSGLSKPRGFMNRVVRRLLGMRPKPPPKYRILTMMATNLPESLDEALLRPGRIDRIYKVGYPSKEGRMRTYAGYFSKVRNEITDEQIEMLATMTPYATGATIKDLVNESLINSIRERRDIVTWRDVLKAKQLKDFGPPEDVEYVERERHSVAIHEACHAVVTARLPREDWAIDVATIEKGGTYLGLVRRVRVEDTFTNWRSDFEADIMIALASLAGERAFFDGDSASGVSGDLSSATWIATAMEGYWGMGQTIASHEVTQEAGVGGGRARGRGEKEEKDLLDVSLGGRIESKLADLFERTQQILDASRFEVLALAHALEVHKTITGQDVLAIVDGHEGPFIDGRLYREPGFAAELEAYHAAALAAHKSRTHSAFGIPELPRPVVVPEVGSPVGNGNSSAAGSASDPDAILPS